MRRVYRWRWLGAVLMGLGLLAGCQQHHFMTETDFNRHRQQALCGVTGADCVDPADAPHSPIPGRVSTVLSPGGTPRYMTLAECLALAMENGRTTESFDTADTRRLLPGPTGGARVGASSDALRVFAYDPPIQAVDIEQALAKFDPVYRGTFSTSKVDRPVGTALDTFQGAFSQINAIAQDTATFQNSILKPLPSGGLAGITFNTDYEFSNLNARVNPSYRPLLSLSVEQPLLRGFGVGINQLTDALPGFRNLGQVGGRVPGILLSRLNTDQAHVEFERRVSTVCFAVEEAYWQLYAAYWEKYARETALRQVLESWNIANAKHRAGSATLLEVRTAEVQFRQTQVQLLTAIGQGNGNFAPGVLEAERKLRYAIGLPIEDGTRLIPADTPTDAPFRPDLGAAVNEALALRPDMRQIRMEIQRSHFDVLRSNNNALPDIRAFGNYDLAGLGNQLDGNTPANALFPITHNQYQNWTLGVNASFTFGGRSENADIQRAKLLLAQRYVFLQKQEEATTTLMGAVIRNLVQLHRSIELNRLQREAANETVRLRYQAYRAGKETIDFLLRAQQDFANALSAEQSSIANYNIALANFELQKGTMLAYDNVKIMEGPLPDCVAARASEHLRQRAGALIIKESSPGPLFDQTGGLIMPDLPRQGTVSLKEVDEATKTLPKVPEQLKVPQEEPKPPTEPVKPQNIGIAPEMPPVKR